jgi:hypothetical protein
VRALVASRAGCIAIALCLLVAAGCEGSGGALFPGGWTGTERVELREGRWRFFRTVDTERRSSVSEENYVVRDRTRMAGADGIRAFLQDPDVDAAAIAAPRLAAQLAMFLVEGTSRSSSAFTVVDQAALDTPRFAVIRGELHPVVIAADGDGHVLTAWIEVDTGLRHLVVRWSRARVTVDFDETRPRP